MREYEKQGKFGNCTIVALRNIYKHFGVGIDITNRDTLNWGYMPNHGGDSNNIFKMSGIIYKEIKSLNKKRTEKLIVNGLNNGKIYAVKTWDKDDSHIYLITEKNLHEITQSNADGEGFSIRETYEKYMFIAINRRSSGLDYENCTENYAYEDNPQDIEIVSAKIINGDLGFLDEKRHGYLIEISGISKTYKNSKIYKFNPWLKTLLELYRYEIREYGKEDASTLVKLLIKVAHEYINEKPYKSSSRIYFIFSEHFEQNFPIVYTFIEAILENLIGKPNALSTEVLSNLPMIINERRVS